MLITGMFLIALVLGQQGQCFKRNKNPISGKHTGIGSWFRANFGGDETNGNSWCGYPYQDHTNGFAISLGRMTDYVYAKYPHPRWAEFGSKYCGLEAKVTNLKTGTSKLMYIVDAFDDKWLKSPFSIDIMINNYQELTGDYSMNKANVINIEWELTGRKYEKYKFGGVGDP